MKIRKAVIPAAGLGSRMLPAAKTVPKEMFPVADRPVLHYIVEEAVAAGIEEIIILTNRSKTVMHDYFDYTPELEEKLRAAGKHAEVEALRAIADMADITFVRQKQTLGLGHAVWCTRRIVGDEPFAVLLGDDLMRSRTPVIGQLIDAAERYGAAAVGVQAVSKEDICKYCSLDVTHREGNIYDVHGMVEKPRPEEILSNFAILGRYVLTPRIFEILESLPAGHGGEIQLTDGLNALCRVEPMVAVDFEGERHDTGSLEGYFRAMLHFSAEHPRLAPVLDKFLQERGKK